MSRISRKSQLALLVTAICASPALWAQSTAATDVGRIAVEGAQGGTSTGLIVQEDTPKARSSVNRAHLDTLNPTANPYQAIELLPGVSTFSQDATGLFGGGLRVRGANSDQMGFTVNGAPVNDSGNFAVYPMEYADTENLCEIFVTQGSTDTEAPHVGASGGNIGMVTCAPKDKYTVSLTESVGDLHLNRTFVRLDTGKFADDSTKAFISYSKATADKFKGMGSALKEHVDLGLEFKPNDIWFASTSLLWNKAYNNNIRTLTKAQIAVNQGLDFGTTPPAQTATAAPADGYYADNINPFLNLLWTGKVEYKASKDTSFSVEPYYWYGHGTGGGQLQILNENAGSTLLGGGIGKDLNGNGNATDPKALVYGSNVTETNRPGVTFKTNTRWGNNDILAGYWYEQARHVQTAPRELLNAAGQAPDPWQFNSDSYILQQNGQPVMARNEITVSTASSLFAQDTINLMDDKLSVQAGLRNASIQRDFTSYANLNGALATGSQFGDYSISKTYSMLLPSVGMRYRLDGEQQVFANVAQNMKAPGNFSFEKLLVGGAIGTITPGVLSGATMRNPTVDLETSTNLDLGYRVAKDDWTFSGSVYYIDFNNRIASAYDAATNLSIDTNVGKVITQGLELETGYKLASNWTLYGSMSYTSSKMQSNLITGATTTEATGGKQMPDTPEFMSALSVAYNSSNWYGNVDLKYTGQSYSTLVNDETMGDYSVVNLTAGYRLAGDTFFKKPSIQMNIVNLFNANYLRISSPSGSSFTTRAQGAGGSAPSYYVSAPMFMSITLRSEF